MRSVASGSLSRNDTIGSAGWNGTTPPSVRAFLIPKPERSVRQLANRVHGANGPFPHVSMVRCSSGNGYRAKVPPAPDKEEQT
jgi:hypothetical protein